MMTGSMDDRALGANASVQIAEQLKGQQGIVFHMYDGYGHAAYDTAPDYKERMMEFFVSE